MNCPNCQTANPDAAKFCMNCGHALADEIMPSIRQWGFAFLAEAYFRQGDLAAGREALAQSQVGFHPDQPPGAFSPIYIPLAEARLALAEGDYGCAVTLMDVLIARLRQYGLRAWLAEALYLKGKALLEQNRLEEARATLAEGRLEAESTGSRRVLWPILVQLAQAEARRGNTGEAGDLRRQAQEIVIFMADRMGTAELRTTFMSLADARSIFEEIS